MRRRLAIAFLVVLLVLLAKPKLYLRLALVCLLVAFYAFLAAELAFAVVAALSSGLCSA